jgi:hypothetical protein
MKLAIVASLLLGLAAAGLGVASLNNTSDSAGPVPVTTIVAPVTGTTLSGVVLLDARPIGTNVVAVDFLATGATLNDAKIGTGMGTLVGFTVPWDTRTEVNGTYSLVSVSYDAQGQSSRSSTVVVTVRN